MSKFQCKQNSKFKVSSLVVILLVTFVILSSRVYASGGVLRPGWNIVSWQAEWGNGVKYSSLPAGCSYLSVKKNGWFEPWIRDYSADKNFAAGNNYYIKCASETSWNF